MSNFDENSGVRERLALMAEMGPSADFARFRYDSHRDTWRLRGNHHGISVRQEGSRSLELIAERYHITSKIAMSLIGYPESC